MNNQNPNAPGTMGPGSPETISHKKSNLPLYAGVAIAVIALAVVGVGYEAGWFTKTTTKTVTQTECPQGDTGTYPNCVAPTGPVACAPASTSQTVDISGSTFVAPLMDYWESQYSVGSNTLNYDSVGSGTGISNLASFADPVAASDAPVTYAQMKSDFSSNPILTMPEAAGGAAVIYNLVGNWHSPLNLTASVLAGIFQGTITTWSATQIQSLNTADALPSTPISVVYRTGGSGTSYMFQQFLQWDSGGAWNLNYSTSWLASTGTGASGSSGVTNAVKTTTGAISYVDLEYAIASGGVEMAAVQNVQGDFVVPTIASITTAITDKTEEAGFALPAGNQNWSGVNMLNAPNGAGTNYAYPIASFTYLMYYEYPSTALASVSADTESALEAVANFLNWSVSSSGGQAYSAQNYYVPIPSFVTAADQKTIGMMEWDSTSIPACASGTGPAGYTYGGGDS